MNKGQNNLRSFYVGQDKAGNLVGSPMQFDDGFYFKPFRDDATKKVLCKENAWKSIIRRVSSASKSTGRSHFIDLPKYLILNPIQDSNSDALSAIVSNEHTFFDTPEVNSNEGECSVQDTITAPAENQQDEDDSMPSTVIEALGAVESTFQEIGDTTERFKANVAVLTAEYRSLHASHAALVKENSGLNNEVVKLHEALVSAKAEKERLLSQVDLMKAEVLAGFERAKMVLQSDDAQSNEAADHIAPQPVPNPQPSRKRGRAIDETPSYTSTVDSQGGGDGSKPRRKKRARIQHQPESGDQHHVNMKQEPE